ncbi:MAG: general secretion pathway protein GspK [Akkermansiaceae bacterium]|nr:general secretion pathway protein GspK [Akkermansiaceae bacterium]NJR43687.1 general secretion pathway protein GspK [Akkermansiaceae bacterium]
MISSAHHRKSRGAALIAVIVLISIVSLACISTLRVISFDAELASAKIHGSRARQVAEMGIAVGTNSGITKRFDPLLHRMDQEAGEGYDVEIISEGGKFNINFIIQQEDKELLKSMFIKWGLELDDAQVVVDSLIDWSDPGDETQLNGAEVDFYKKEGRINQPFNRPFYSLEEMSLVRGMNLIERVKPDWREWFTIWSDGPLDVNEASSELLAVAGDADTARTDIVPETVRGPDGVLGTEDDVPFQDAASALDLMGLDPNAPEAARFTAAAPLNETVRIESTGFAEGAKRKITVIVRNRAQNPTLLERTEEIIP